MFPDRLCLACVLIACVSAGPARAADWPYAPNEKNCCQDNTLYSGIGEGAKPQPCTGEGGIGGRPFCGWNGSHYDCDTDGKGDPTGENPYSCAHPTDCVPDCAARTCGPDGCGGLCGTCGDADFCGADQTCHASECGDVTDAGCCVPDGLRKCSKKLLFQADCANCGWDASMGEYRCFTAGTPDPSGAHPFLCPGVTTCTPDCAGKACGGDGCGTSCGTCTDGLECRSGQCLVPGLDSGCMADTVWQADHGGAGTEAGGTSDLEAPEGDTATGSEPGGTSDLEAPEGDTAAGSEPGGTPDLVAQVGDTAARTGANATSEGCGAGRTSGSLLPIVVGLAAAGMAFRRRRAPVR